MGKGNSPTTTLRKWFNHDPEKFANFKIAYKKELLHDTKKLEKLSQLQNLQKNQQLILLYGAKDTKHNHAQVLKKVLESDLSSPIQDN